MALYKYCILLLLFIYSAMQLAHSNIFRGSSAIVYDTVIKFSKIGGYIFGVSEVKFQKLHSYLHNGFNFISYVCMFIGFPIIY